MSGPKISVSADVSGIQAELAKVETSAKRINDTLASGQVGIDIKTAKRDLATLQKSASDLADSLAQASEKGSLDGLNAGHAAKALDEAAKAATALDKVLDAVGQSKGLSATVRASRDTAEHIKRATRAQEVFHKEGIKLSRQQVDEAKRGYDQLAQSGARGSGRLRGMGFDDWVSGGWKNHSVNQRESENRRRDILRHIGIDQGGSGSSNRLVRANAAAGALGGMAAGMLGGGDGGIWQSAGNAAGSGIGAGAGMMMGGPIGAIVGAFASRLLGGIGGSMDSNINKVGDEGSTYTDLRQSLGATKVDFEMLRGSVRHASDGMGLAYNEAAKLAKEFAHTAGMKGDESKTLGQEVRSAVGFGRSYGIDPGQSTQFMANMRHLGVAGGERDQKRLAMLIGESVSKGGTSGKMDEVLSAVQTYTQMATRASLSSADVGAYASFMSSMTGLSMAGMKGSPGAAAGAMGAADSALRQGGAFGDASKSFSLGIYQRQLKGFTAYDLDYMNEQGAFGSIDKAFGKDSAAYKLAESRGDKTKMAQYDDWASQGKGKTVMSMQMDALSKQFGGNTDEFRLAIQSHFGVSASQASALYQAHQNDRGLGGLEKTLKDAGVDVGSMNSKQIASLAELAVGGKGAISTQAKKLRTMKLSKEDAGLLNSADTDDKLRQTVLKLSAKYDTMGDAGEQQRKVQADMSNAVQEMATKLVPATIAIKDGIVELVRKFAGDSAFVKQMDREKLAESAKAAIDGASDKTGAARKIIEDANRNPGKYDKAFIDSLVGSYGATPPAEQQAGMSKAQPISGDKADFLKKTRAAAEQAAEKINRETGSNVSAEAIQAQWGLETGWGKSVLPGTNNLGNIKGSYRGNSKQFRVKEYDSRGREFYANQDFRAYGSFEEAGSDYADLIARKYLKGKPAASDAEYAKRLKAGGYATDPDYENKLLASRASIAGQADDGKVPAGMRGADSGTFSGNQRFSFEHSVKLFDRNGSPITDPILMTSTGAPRAAGSRG